MAVEPDPERRPLYMSAPETVFSQGRECNYGCPHFLFARP